MASRSLHLTLHRTLQPTSQDGGTGAAVEADPEALLLDVLRRSLGIRSATRGCQDGSCGSCRVLLNGSLVSSCLVKWGEVADGATVESYETLADDPAAARAVSAFAAERPTRCRLCVGALGVTAVALARASAGENAPDRDAAIDVALERATCMCTGKGSWRRALSG